MFLNSFRIEYWSFQVLNKNSYIILFICKHLPYRCKSQQFLRGFSHKFQYFEIRILRTWPMHLYICSYYKIDFPIISKYRLVLPCLIVFLLSPSSILIISICLNLYKPVQQCNKFVRRRVVGVKYSQEWRLISRPLVMLRDNYPSSWGGSKDWCCNKLLLPLIFRVFEGERGHIFGGGVRVKISPNPHKLQPVCCRGCNCSNHFFPFYLR